MQESKDVIQESKDTMQKSKYAMLQCYQNKQLNKKTIPKSNNVMLHLHD